SLRAVLAGLGVRGRGVLGRPPNPDPLRRTPAFRFLGGRQFLQLGRRGLASMHGLMAGTDRGTAWLAILYGVSVASVLMLLVWRFGGSRRAPRIASTGAVALVALPLLILGPLRHSSPLWNAAHVNESLTGSVIRNGTQTQQIV